jgi:hypothetical protein
MSLAVMMMANNVLVFGRNLNSFAGNATGEILTSELKFFQKNSNHSLILKFDN